MGHDGAYYPVLILDPIRLGQLKPQTEVMPRDPVFVTAISTILKLLRKLAPIEEGIGNLVGHMWNWADHIAN